MAFGVAGLVSVVVAVYVLARPELKATDLLLLLGSAVALNSSRTFIAGGRLFRSAEGTWALPTWGWKALRELGLLGSGLIALAIAVGVVLYPGTAVTVTASFLALALVVQGLGRVLEGIGGNIPGWLRGSSIATGAVIVVLVAATVAFEGFALLGFAIVVGVVLLVNGIETLVAGLRPTEPRQFVLLKLILFAALYGLVLINWIDLFGKNVPAYGVWLILTYMAPFGVLLVFEGWATWPIATSLGLLVSLLNDVGYFFVGNLLFGFHRPLGPWIAGQLGFRGSELVTSFDAGPVHLGIASWMMGLSIYARGVVVTAILYYWWRHPSWIVRPSAEPAAGPKGAPPS